MKLFIVAVPRFRERFRYITAHVSERSNLPSEIVGVDGRHVLDESKEGPCKHNPSLSEGQIGCALSHVEVYRRIRDQNLDWGVVVEDDIILPDNIDDIIRDLGTELRAGEIISLYNPIVGCGEFSNFSAIKIAQSKLLHPMEARFTRTSAAYIIHRDAAIAIAARNDPVRYEADNYDAFYFEGHINFIRVLHPTPCEAKPFVSSIGYHTAGSLMERLSRMLNSLPVSSQLMAYRRRQILSMQSRDLVEVEKASRLAMPNPSF